MRGSVNPPRVFRALLALVVATWIAVLIVAALAIGRL